MEAKVFEDGTRKRFTFIVIQGPCEWIMDGKVRIENVLERSKHVSIFTKST
jgi:hypothetical protein